MSKRGPLLTLVGGGAVAAALLVASVNAARGGDDRDDTAAGATTPPEVTESPTGAPTDEPTDEPPADADNEPDPVTYVGWVDGGGASVAIIIDGDEATAYVCDGATVEVWLSGPARNGELLLDGEEGTLTGSYDADQATGETTAQGIDWTFTVEEVAAPEGLYRVADTIVGGAEVDGGWIVLPDGTQVGVLTVDGTPAPAPALDPAAGEVEVDGETVTVDRQG